MAAPAGRRLDGERSGSPLMPALLLALPSSCSLECSEWHSGSCSGGEVRSGGEGDEVVEDCSALRGVSIGLGGRTTQHCKLVGCYRYEYEVRVTTHTSS